MDQFRLKNSYPLHAVNFLNDFKSFEGIIKQILEFMPLGSGAISGTHLKIDLERLAENLGFANAPINSVHSVSDRDYLIDLMNCLSKTALHLVRFCEDIINYSSTPLAIIELPSEWSSGSSMMPNKKNPDFFEVVRGRAKRVMNLSQSALQMSASLGSGYSSDFHELKRMTILEVQSFEALLAVFSDVVPTLQLNPKRCLESLGRGHILATDIANQLVEQGLSFRDAYKQVAIMVYESDIQNVQISSDGITMSNSVENRDCPGGTSRRQILNSIEKLRQSAGEL